MVGVSARRCGAAARVLGRMGLVAVAMARAGSRGAARPRISPARRARGCSEWCLLARWVRAAASSSSQQSVSARGGLSPVAPAAEEEDYFSPEQRELRWELRSKLYLLSQYPNERPGEIEGRDFQFTMDAEFMVCRCDMCGRGFRCGLSQVTDAELLASWERDDREEEEAELKRKLHHNTPETRQREL